MNTSEPQTGQEYERLYALALQLYEAAQYEDALTQFSSLSAVRDKDFRVWELLAILYAKLDRHAEALEASNQVKRLGHSCYNCHYNRWLILCQLGRPEDGVRALELALRERPDDAGNWLQRGLVYGAFQEPGAAHQHFHLVDPKPHRAAMALESFDRALQLNPDLFEAWIHKAMTLERLLHVGQAVTRLLGPRPGYEPHELRENFREAREAFRRACELRPEDAEVWRRRARFLVGLTHDAELDREALQVLSQAIELEGDNASAWYECSGAHLRLGEEEEARSTLKRATELEPSLLEDARSEFPALFPRPAEPDPPQPQGWLRRLVGRLWFK